MLQHMAAERLTLTNAQLLVKIELEDEIKLKKLKDLIFHESRCHISWMKVNILCKPKALV